MEGQVVIRRAAADDAAALLEIYEPYITDTVITFEYEVPAAAEFLHERGMAVYAENDEYVSYLVVAEAAHDLADAMELPEAERTALRQADDILIVGVAKTAPAVEEPAENTPAGEEESE